ncbi:hypothetical protein Hanom_Chr08g00732131 [Helianthus anomalus]
MKWSFDFLDTTTKTRLYQPSLLVSSTHNTSLDISLSLSVLMKTTTRQQIFLTHNHLFSTPPSNPINKPYGSKRIVRVVMLKVYGDERRWYGVGGGGGFFRG